MINFLTTSGVGFDSRQGQWRDFSLRNRIQIGPGAHSVLYSRYRGFFPWGTTAGAWSYTYHKCPERLNCVVLR